jgi:hypothetical protein
VGGYDFHTIIITLISSVTGGGLGSYIMRLIMKNEAKEALKPELQKIEKELQDIKEDYVTCQVCSSKHSSVDTILTDMNHKLDILIENAIKKTK